MTCKNSADPLLLPWANVTVSSDGLASFRGIKVAIGTPPQTFSLIPSTSYNNLWVVNITECGSTFNDSCIGPLGGVYDPEVSSTYYPTTLSNWNGSYDTPIIPGYFEIFNDDLRFGENTTVYGFPCIMERLYLG